VAEPAVVDTSPLVVLSRADELHLLQIAAQEVVIPAAVHREVAAYGPDDPTVKAIAVTPWLKIVASPRLPQTIESLDLGPGESEVIAWALAHPGCEAIIDDLAARRHAASLGVTVVGTVGLVLRAKQRGIFPQARPILEALRRSGLYLSDSILNQALARVDE
jgi:predicted nucleic acid-binding protein